MKNTKHLCLFFMVLMGLSSCEGFLEEKPVKSILVPQTVEDVRALLDNYTTLNDNTLIDFIMADDWITENANWDRLNPWEQNAYLWNEQIFEPAERSTDYSKLHKKIFVANVSLDVLEEMDSTDREVQNLKGEALFVRALALFQLSQLFLPSPKTNGELIKMPLKLTPNIDQASEWWSVSEVLAQAEQDLFESFDLLDKSSQFKSRPNKKVAKAVLSRLYLYVENWEGALEAASYVLNLEGNNLMDYRKMDTTLAYPFQLFNSEVLYYGITSSFSVTASAATLINPVLIQGYGKGDLRKALFFTRAAQNGYLFKGSYNGDYNLFTGITLPEMYLTGAEALVRIGKEKEGIDMLSSLGVKRYLTIADWEANLSKNPLKLVQEERQKELVFRGTRWMDIKRLLALGELDQVPTREIGGKRYELKNPGQLYLAIPANELDLDNK